MENQVTRDSYYIVKNIIRQILHTLPFLKDYLLISSSNKFKWLIQELEDNSFDITKEGKCLNQQNHADVFVKFIKRINELKLDFNIVIAITGIEYAFDASHLQNIVYLIRAASVFLNQNSFVKFILTMKHCEEPSPAFKKLQDEQS